MAAVHLEFQPPDTDDIATLHVEEAPAATGTFAEVQTFPAGTFPNYIHEVDVTAATSATDWFRIRWETTAGGFTEYSNPIQGGTTTIVAKVTDRVLLRDPTVNAIIAGQEAEAAVAEYFNVDDPYSIDVAKATPKVLSGLTLLALARSYTLRLITSSGHANKWTAGLISMDTGTTTSQSWDSVDRMIELANRELGRNYSRVLLMKEIEVAGGLRQLKSLDVSRALIEIA